MLAHLTVDMQGDGNEDQKVADGWVGMVLSIPRTRKADQKTTDSTSLITQIKQEPTSKILVEKGVVGD